MYTLMSMGGHYTGIAELTPLGGVSVFVGCVLTHPTTGYVCVKKTQIEFSVMLIAEQKI